MANTATRRRIKSLADRIHKIELQIRQLRLQIERFPQLNWAELTEYLDQTEPKASWQGLATIEALEKRVNEIEIPIQQMVLRLERLPQEICSMNTFYNSKNTSATST